MLKNKMKDRVFVIQFALTLAVILCAIFLYFVRLDYDTSLVNDEHQSFSVAYNLLNGNGLVRNDFQHSYNNPSPYTRGWPSTYLLAGWMKLFGVKEATCRALSAVYGIMFIGSLLYISYRLVNNYWYSLLAVAMSIGVYDVTKYFRTIRMYSLELLISIWLYYFAYKFVNGTNRLWKDKAGNNIVRKCLDYDWAYFLPVVILAFLCFENFVNGVILLGGVVLYVVVQAFVKKKAKYIFATTVVVFSFVVSLLNIIYYNLCGNFLFAAKIFKKFIYYFGVEFQPLYLKTVLTSCGNWILGIVLLIVIGISILVLKKTENEFIYIFCINLFTIFFYCFFSAGRYTFRSRYILDLIPWSILLLGYAFAYTYRINIKLSVVILVTILFFSGAHFVNFSKMYAFEENVNDIDYITAYTKVSDYYDIENENIPIAYSYMRSWYSTKVFNNITSKSLKRAYAFDDWIKFAQENSEGILTVEYIKTDKLKQDVPKILYKWTDRISGDGVDNTGVNVSHYCFVNCTENNQLTETGAYKGDNGIWVTFDEKTMSNITTASVQPTVVFVSINLDDTTRFFGMIMPPKTGNTISFYISPEHLRNIDLSAISEISLNDEIGIYADNTLIEGYLLH